MPEDYEEFISSTLWTRNSKRPFGMLASNWKHQWLPLCLARQARRVSMGRPVAKPMRPNQNLRASWKPVNPQDCVWKNLYQITMRTILQEKVRIHNNITIWYTNIFLCFKPWRFPQHMQQWIRNGKNRKRYRHGTWRKSEVKKQVIDEARTSGAQDHFASLDGHMSFEKWWIGVKAPEIQRSSCTPWWYCKRRLRVLRSIHWTRIISISNDCSKKSWISSPDCLVAMDKQRTQKLLIPK